ncbi:BA75_04080T0 [Komagataella pastoris]|uniref:BA75_04080T0 n=1 Tax=Komagataella pastoris TaxID=4922 RepID=A0A1B2JF31_PICPA|nr:BA75_04080T0 [Komagataella pastoris]
MLLFSTLVKVAVIVSHVVTFFLLRTPDNFSISHLISGPRISLSLGGNNDQVSLKGSNLNHELRLSADGQPFDGVQDNEDVFSQGKTCSQVGSVYVPATTPTVLSLIPNVTIQEPVLPSKSSPFWIAGLMVLSSVGFVMSICEMYQENLKFLLVKWFPLLDSNASKIYRKVVRLILSLSNVFALQLLSTAPKTKIITETQSQTTNSVAAERPPETLSPSPSRFPSPSPPSSAGFERRLTSTLKTMSPPKTLVNVTRKDIPDNHFMNRMLYQAVAEVSKALNMVKTFQDHGLHDTKLLSDMNYQLESNIRQSSLVFDQLRFHYLNALSKKKRSGVMYLLKQKEKGFRAKNSKQSLNRPINGTSELLEYKISKIIQRIIRIHIRLMSQFCYLQTTKKTLYQQQFVFQTLDNESYGADVVRFILNSRHLCQEMIDLDLSEYHQSTAGRGNSDHYQIIPAEGSSME